MPGRGWHPVAASTELPYRHVFQGQLQGREFAIWRADDDTVNVWENRCLHRGVRLSIGSNNGAELKCFYHGWRYASATAACVYIPAHPADAPSRTIHNRTFPVVEHAGLIWTTLDAESPFDVPRPLATSEADADEHILLRPIPVHAPAAQTALALRDYTFRPTDADAESPCTTTILELDEFALDLQASVGPASARLLFLVQPTDANACIVRGVLLDAPASERGYSLRTHNSALEELRTHIEAEARRNPPLTPVADALVAVPLELGPHTSPDRRSAPQRVRVARKFRAAEDVVGLELEPLGGVLAAYQPGAHIDVHLGNGLIRQYSLASGPGESGSYRIGVKREPDSRGGSSFVHDSVREGDVLAVSVPRNSFRLRRDATRTILIAGGIGITPLLAMAETLRHDAVPYELHCFVRSSDHLPFADVVARHGDAVTRHIGLDPAGTAGGLRRIIANREPAWHVYVCGPAPMLSMARTIAAELGWPDDRVHFEYFKNTNEIDDSSSFEIALARSGVTHRVRSGESILDVLRRAGIDVPSSCEQGACGTCRVAVIDGEPDHQDVHLNDTERAANDVIMTCVSRARSDRLVLDV